MPSWLVEDPTPVYVILGTAVVILLALYWNRRKRGYLYGVGGVFLLIGLVWLIDFLVVTDREKVQAALRAMAGRIQALDVDGAFQFVSDDYDGPHRPKKEFREWCRSRMAALGVSELRVWDETVVEASAASRTGRAEFMIKGQGSIGQGMYLVRANFVLDPDGQWRLRNFTLHNPAANTNEALPLP
jgi:hypothetical protein